MNETTTAPTPIPWTSEQAAILRFDAPNDLLVSAGAGSGKTLVLTERIARRLIDGMDPDRLLVLTFTELAAEEMKARILKRIRTARQHATEAGEIARLDQLNQRLPAAQISTFHAFCNRILSEHLQAFRDERDADAPPYVEPGYRVLSDEPERALRDEAVDDVLRRFYAEVDRLEQGTLADPDVCLDLALPDGTDPTPFVLTAPTVTRSQWFTDFKTLATAMSYGRDDRSFKEGIVAMLAQLRNYPHYPTIVRRSVAPWRATFETFPTRDIVTPWWTSLQTVYARAADALAQLRRHDPDDADDYIVRMNKNKHKASPKHYGQMSVALDAMADLIDRLAPLVGMDAADVDADVWDRTVAVGRTLTPFSVPSYSLTPAKTRATDLKNHFIARFCTDVLPLAGFFSEAMPADDPMIRPVFTLTSAELRDDFETTVGPVMRFMETVLIVDRVFQRKRFDQNAIIYSDFEHGALQILRDPHIRARYRERFQAIYIDEYQDTSDIQDAILAALGDDNIFMVGDSKQSIYRFRSANPMLFRRREKQATPADAYDPETPVEGASYLAHLNTNFRSHPRIIDAVNTFFNAFLTDRAGGIEYDDRHRLIAGVRADDDDVAPRLTWDIVTEIAAPLEDDVDLKVDTDGMRNKEAIAAARIIDDLIRRGVKTSDIAVLLATNEDCRTYEKVFLQLGIPVVSFSGNKLGKNMVMTQIEALLSTLDNPHQDAPLINVLAGPFAPSPWNGEDLLSVAEFGDDARAFHERFFEMAATKRHPLADRARTFLEVVRRWRMMAEEHTTRDLLERIVEATHYDTYLAQTRFGAMHLEDLERVLDVIETLEADRIPSLRATAHAFSDLMADDTPLDDADVTQLPDRGVRILTHFKSKGLEWDHVIVGTLDKPFVRRDRRKDALVHFSEHYELSSLTIADGGLSVYNNVIHTTRISDHEARDLAERWRVLYVIMTRAKEHLYFVQTENKTFGDNAHNADTMSRVRQRLSPAADRYAHGAIPADVATSAVNVSELILTVLQALAPHEMTTFASGDAERASDVLRSPNDDRPLWHLRVTPWNAVRHAVAAMEEDRAVAPPAPDQADSSDLSDAALDTVDAIKRRLTRDVPRRDAANVPAKLTVSALQRGMPQADDIVVSDDERPIDPSWSIGDLRRKDRVDDVALSLRTRRDARPEPYFRLGTALHAVFQFLDIEQLRGRSEAEAADALTRATERMVRHGILTEDDRDLVLPFAPNALAWANSDLAGRILHAARTRGRVYREMPFTLAKHADAIAPDLPHDEMTLVQGMIDVWFVDDDERAILLDFKSDRLDSKTADDVVRERYRVQLDAYAEAIEHATAWPVKERWIWLIRNDRAVPLHD
ncbi:MAG: UvrD-helicase domain-containing protein [Saccharofermentanales bacterium]|jgi:ATP-dependent helicase/nuclease subunit A